MRLRRNCSLREEGSCENDDQYMRYFDGNYTAHTHNGNKELLGANDDGDVNISNANGKNKYL